MRSLKKKKASKQKHLTKWVPGVGAKRIWDGGKKGTNFQ